MKRPIKAIHVLLISLILVTSCSRKKDNFVSRNFHAVATEFNTLYNGQIAFDDEVNAIQNDFSDNFWEILPVERITITDEIKLGEESENSNFQRAEEKATKSIQKHSMLIKGIEKNPQIDESYLLLGKSRYFDQRFIPALEAFNYILYKYPASDKINTAKVWREKTNMRLDNDDVAIKNLKRLLEQEELEPQELADATSVLAQAYLNQKHIDSAVTQLEIASSTTKNNIEKGRYRFIQGQLYNALGKKDSANYAFDQVIDLNRRIPRIFLITAHLEKFKNFDFKNGNKLELLEKLTALEENRENRPFLDKIYYQVADYHLKTSSDSIAEQYYNKSLRTNSPDKLLIGKNYQALGNMTFDRTEFKIAGAYYDSTLLNLKINSKPYRAIKKKRENLDDVIYYEDIAQYNDSILTLVNLPEAQRLAYFKTYTDQLKKEAEALKEKEKIESRKTSALSNSLSSLNTSPSRFPTTTTANNATGGPFYFYNPQTVAFGKSEFVKRWGDRQLTDNWRLSNSSISSGPLSPGNSPRIDLDLAKASEEELFDPEFYASKIPTDQKVIDSIFKDRNFAYYQLGLIYKEKFKEYTLAKDKLELLLKNNPEDRLVLPSKYNLYKVYQLLNLDAEAEIAKNDIITKHPDSRYASILLNPNAALSEDENSPENTYKKLYTRFENQEYNDVIKESDKFIIRFDGEDIVPKFEFLKAVSKARLFGFDSYKEAINFIALNYPNSDEGKRAQEMLQSVFPLMENSEFIPDESSKNFKTIFEFKNLSSTQINEFIKKLNKTIVRIPYFKLTLSKDIYTDTTTFVVLHGFNSIEGARGFSDLVKESNKKAEKQIIISKPYFGVSSKNYEIIQIHKNLDEYLKLNSN